MKIYRVSLQRLDGDGSGGFFYAASRKQAKEFIKSVEETCECETTILHVPVTQEGILDALNRYGGHADNG